MHNNSTNNAEDILAAPLAGAVSCLSQYFNKDISQEYLLEALNNDGGPVELSFAERILSKNGLSVSVSQNETIDTLRAPSCIRLNNGKFATILRITDDRFFIADPKTDGGVQEIEKNQLSEAFSGVALFAAESLEEIEARLISPPQTGHWFWREIRAQRRLFQDAVIGSLCANLLAACIALFSLQIYDRVIPHQSIATLWVLVSGVGIAIMIEALLRISRAHLLDASGRQLELRLSGFLFERFLGARLSHQTMSPGAQIHAVKEFGSVREFFTATSIGSAADIPFAILFLGLIFAIAGNVAFAILIAMGLIVLPSLLAQKKIAKLSEETLGASSVAGKLLIETAYAQDTVKANQAEGFYQKKWEDIVTLNAVKTTEQRTLSAGLTHSANAIQQYAYVVAIILGVFLVFDGEFTVGSIIAVSILSTRTLSPITQLSSIITRWKQVKASMTALEGIANSEQDRPQERTFLRRQSFDGSINIESLQFQYGDKNPTLNIAKLAAKPREKIAVLGVNGSGKTTFLKVISGLYDFSDGALSIDGLDIRQIDPHDLRRNIAYLPQEVKLFAGTLRENLTFGSGRFSEAYILEALAFAGLSSLIESDPNGLDLVIEDGGVGLSLGQRQCVGLARIYLQDPKMVLLDEPTASLDQNNERNIIGNLRTWLEKRTCIMTTHRVQPLELVERIVVLQGGKITLDDERDRALAKLNAQNNSNLQTKTKRERDHAAA